MFSRRRVAFFAALLTATVVSTASSTLSPSIGGLSDTHALIKDEAVTGFLPLSNPLFTSPPASDMPLPSDKDESEDIDISVLDDEVGTGFLPLSNPLFTSPPASDMPLPSDKDESEDIDISVLDDEVGTGFLPLSNPLFTSPPASDMPLPSDKDESEDIDISVLDDEVGTGFLPLSNPLFTSPPASDMPLPSDKDESEDIDISVLDDEVGTGFLPLSNPLFTSPPASDMPLPSDGGESEDVSVCDIPSGSINDAREQSTFSPPSLSPILTQDSDQFLPSAPGRQQKSVGPFNFPDHITGPLIFGRAERSLGNLNDVDFDDAHLSEQIHTSWYLRRFSPELLQEAMDPERQSIHSSRSLSKATNSELADADPESCKVSGSRLIRKNVKEVEKERALKDLSRRRALHYDDDGQAPGAVDEEMPSLEPLSSSPSSAPFLSSSLDRSSELPSSRKASSKSSSRLSRRRIPRKKSVLVAPANSKVSPSNAKPLKRKTPASKKKTTQKGPQSFMDRSSSSSSSSSSSHSRNEKRVKQENISGAARII